VLVGASPVQLNPLGKLIKQAHQRAAERRLFAALVLKHHAMLTPILPHDGMLSARGELALLERHGYGPGTMLVMLKRSMRRGMRSPATMAPTSQTSVRIGLLFCSLLSPTVVSATWRA